MTSDQLRRGQCSAELEACGAHLRGGGEPYIREHKLKTGSRKKRRSGDSINTKLFNAHKEGLSVVTQQGDDDLNSMASYTAVLPGRLSLQRVNKFKSIDKSP